MVSNFILAMVFLEWIFASYIIRTQKDRRVEEITFDHNNENMEDESEDGLDFRKYEIRLRNFFRLLMVLGFLITLPHVFIGQWKLKQKWIYVLFLLALNLLFWSFVIVQYCRLKQMLSSLHKYEYDKNIRYMRIIAWYLILGKIGLILTQEWSKYFSFE